MLIHFPEIVSDFARNFYWHKTSLIVIRFSLLLAVKYHTQAQTLFEYWPENPDALNRILVLPISVLNSFIDVWGRRLSCFIAISLLFYFSRCRGIISGIKWEPHMGLKVVDKLKMLQEVLCKWYKYLTETCGKLMGHKRIQLHLGSQLSCRRWNCWKLERSF